MVVSWQFRIVPDQGICPCPVAMPIEASDDDLPLMVRLDRNVDPQEWVLLMQQLPRGYDYDGTYRTDSGWVHLCRDRVANRPVLVLPVSLPLRVLQPMLLLPGSTESGSNSGN